MQSQLAELFAYAKDYFGNDPEYLWDGDTDTCVLRHQDNKKWYAVIMRIPRSKLRLSGDDIVDILDVKCDPQLLGSMLGKEGCHPAYHMNKSHWLTVRLDGTVPLDEIIGLLEMSYNITKKKLARRRGSE